jgi:hypothetical protein
MLALRTRTVAVARPLGARARSLARARAVPPRRRGAPRRRRVASAAADAFEDDASAEAPPTGVILLFGFHPDEVAPLAELVGELAREMDAGELAVARVAGDALGVTAEFLLDGAEMDETDETSETPSEASKLPPATRCVLLRGEPAKALMPDLKLEMTEAGFEPAVFGAFTPAHAFLPLGAVAGAVVAAHERYWDLGAVANDDDASSCVSTAWPWGGGVVAHNRPGVRDELRDGRGARAGSPTVSTRWRIPRRRRKRKRRAVVANRLERRRRAGRRRGRTSARRAAGRVHRAGLAALDGDRAAAGEVGQGDERRGGRASGRIPPRFEFVGKRFGPGIGIRFGS